MSLIDLLIKKQSLIVEQWKRSVIETYPPDYVRFLTETKDRFANPVGYTMSETIDHLYRWLIGQREDEESSEKDVLFEQIDNIIKIRAVQDFSVSGAVSWVFFLKNVIRKQFIKEIQDQQLYGELLDFESKIDLLAVVIFESFMKNRERIYDIKYSELKRRTSRLLERFGVTKQPDQNAEK
ncbi:MAG: RsbRD N-terminal domain-containing protein [Candidatus Electryoneaceae bacterium]|nr:RsbRD N-terminal domain-containing protein [Candidatus Electryoneaceae bacterium]